LGAGLGFPDEENADTSIGVTLYYKW
jgi:hypothetical protein